jgi:hypothetical protein
MMKDGYVRKIVEKGLCPKSEGNRISIPKRYYAVFLPMQYYTAFLSPYI